MIPLIMPPLAGLSVLVTRPRDQAVRLCEQIEQRGGEAISFPAIAIEPITTAEFTARYDLTIFLSGNAVQHGLVSLARERLGTIAAIGTATAAALTHADMAPDIVPAELANSEGLLAHPHLQSLANARVLIVRGRGGRELLRETLQMRGCTVEVAEVYQRIRSSPSAAEIASLQARWSDEGFGVVTVTSGEILEHLNAILTAECRELLRMTPLVVASERIRATARALGMKGECLVASSAEDDVLVGTLANWRTRARM